MRLLLAAAVLCAAPAVACDGPVTDLVGFVGKDKALLREHYDPWIKLYLADFTAEKVTDYADIVTGEEPAEKREKIRGENWKKAEAKLKKEGLVYAKPKMQKLPLTLSNGVVVANELVSVDSDSGCESHVLVAKVGDKRVELRKVGWCGSSDITSFLPYLTPDGEGVLVMVSGCFNESIDQIFIATTPAALKKQLDAAPATKPKSKP